MAIIFRAILSLIVFITLNAAAQQNHFIYLQTENKQPFFVKLDKKVYSSTVSGYLIIPKLYNGNYLLSVGFPKSEIPEQKFNCSIDKRDVGYLIKNFGDKGWGLFNLQSLEVVMQGNGNADKKDKDIAAADPFSEKLATVVKDPSISKPATKNNPETPVTPPVNNEVTVTPNKTTDTVAVVKQSVIPEEPILTKDTINTIVTQVEAKDSVLVQSTITKTLSTSDTSGISLVYIDRFNGKTDTVSVFIASEKAVEIEPVAQTGVKPQTVQDSIEVQAPPVVTKEKDKFLEIELPNPNKTTSPPIDSTSKPAPVSAVEKSVELPKSNETVQPTTTPAKALLINSDCKAEASEDDFLKLRKKMAAGDNDDDMMAIAKKVLKQKCFTTEQVKNLSVLFLKDAGKYSFFDLCYPFVSDTYNFPSLEHQLTDEYYINRFKVMIRH